MNDETLLAMFAEGLEVDPSTLSPETVIADVDEWNSLGWLTIMSLVDERYGVQLTATEIRSFTRARDVMDALRVKTAAAGG